MLTAAGVAVAHGCEISMTVIVGGGIATCGGQGLKRGWPLCP
jgi:hypothetical protein